MVPDGFKTHVMLNLENHKKREILFGKYFEFQCSLNGIYKANAGFTDMPSKLQFWASDHEGSLNAKDN